MPPSNRRNDKNQAINDQQWSATYKRLVQYKVRSGNCLVPDRYKEDIQLSLWVQQQRKRKQRGSLTSAQTDKLNSIGFAWQIRESWDDTFKRLVDYKNKHGNCIVPRSYKDDMKLARWVNKQRSNYCRDDGATFPSDRLDKLVSIGFEFRLKSSNQWDEMFNRLLQYKEEHGNCLVPQDYESDPQLGRWVNNRRMDYRKGNLAPENVEQLKAINFTFGDTRENMWDEMYNRLVKYKEQYGDCLVPRNWKHDTKLSNWVCVQRKKKDKLAIERKSKLDDIGFAWSTAGRKRQNKQQPKVQPKRKQQSSPVPVSPEVVKSSLISNGRIASIKLDFQGLVPEETTNYEKRNDQQQPIPDHVGSSSLSMHSSCKVFSDLPMQTSASHACCRIESRNNIVSSSEDESSSMSRGSSTFSRTSSNSTFSSSSGDDYSITIMEHEETNGFLPFENNDVLQFDITDLPRVTGADVQENHENKDVSTPLVTPSGDSFVEPERDLCLPPSVSIEEMFGDDCLDFLIEDGNVGAY